MREHSDLAVLVGTECTPDYKELAWKYLEMLHPIPTFSLLKFNYMHVYVCEYVCHVYVDP